MVSVIDVLLFMELICFSGGHRSGQGFSRQIHSQELPSHVFHTRSALSYRIYWWGVSACLFLFQGKNEIPVAKYDRPIFLLTITK